MAELISLITVGVAVVCIVLAIGSRDRMRTLEFRLALIERRIREGQPESSATPAVRQPHRIRELRPKARSRPSQPLWRSLASLSAPTPLHHPCPLLNPPPRPL